MRVGLAAVKESRLRWMFLDDGADLGSQEALHEVSKDLGELFIPGPEPVAKDEDKEGGDE